MSGNSELTPDEIQAGWHWCWEMDGLLVGPGCHDLNGCRCLPANHPVYLTTPPMEIDVIADIDAF